MNIAELRAITPGCQHRNHLNNAGAALLTAPTIAAMTHQLQLETQIGGYEAAEAAADKIDDTYLALGELLGASASEIALFDNSTHAWNAAFYSVPLAAGDRILTGRDEYGSNVLAYLQIAARTGAEVVVVPDDESGQIDLDALAGLVDERTKLIGLTWVPTAGGLVNPAAEVGRIARDTDTLFLLDATQAVGQFPIDVAALGCDMLTGTGRKFLRGPRGTGFLYAGPRAIDRLEPFVAEIRSATWDGDRSFTWADGARGSRPGRTATSTSSGSEWRCARHSTSDWPKSARAVVISATGYAAASPDTPGVTTHDLGREQCAIVTARVSGTDSADVADALAAHGINVSTTVPGHNQFDIRNVHPLVRLSPHYYNTDDEIDQAIEAVAALAR